MQRLDNERDMGLYFLQTYSDHGFEVPSGVWKHLYVRYARAWHIEVNLMALDLAASVVHLKKQLEVNHKWRPDTKVGPDFNIVVMDPPKVKSIC